MCGVPFPERTLSQRVKVHLLKHLTFIWPKQEKGKMYGFVFRILHSNIYFLMWSECSSPQTAMTTHYTITLSSYCLIAQQHWTDRFIRIGWAWPGQLIHSHEERQEHPWWGCSAKPPVWYNLCCLKYKTSTTVSVDILELRYLWARTSSGSSLDSI